MEELERLKNQLLREEEKYDNLSAQLERKRIQKLNSQKNRISQIQKNIDKYLENIVDCSVFRTQLIVSIYADLFNVFECVEVEYIDDDDLTELIDMKNYKYYNVYCATHFFERIFAKGYIIPKDLIMKLKDGSMTSTELDKLLFIMRDKKYGIEGYFKGFNKFYEIDDSNNTIRFMFDYYPEYFKSFIDFAVAYRVENNLRDLEYDKEEEMLKKLESEFLKSGKDQIKKFYEEREKEEQEEIERRKQGRSLILSKLDGIE